LKRAFFKILFKDIHSNIQFKEQRIQDMRYSITRIFAELNRIQNDNGYLLVITTWPDELNDALELIDNHVSYVRT
jgi:hypothetical protein